MFALIVFTARASYFSVQAAVLMMMFMLVSVMVFVFMLLMMFVRVLMIAAAFMPMFFHI